MASMYKNLGFCCRLKGLVEVDEEMLLPRSRVCVRKRAAFLALAGEYCGCSSDKKRVRKQLLGSSSISQWRWVRVATKAGCGKGSWASWEDEEGVEKAAAEESGVQRTRRLEGLIGRLIFNCRFFTIMAVMGSLAGSLLCFFKGCLFIMESFSDYFFSHLAGLGTGKVVLLLVDAVDVCLVGTVMLIFGLGLYELFICSLTAADAGYGRTSMCGSNLFGLFYLRERPKWLEIRSLDELQTKLGHVIVMILLVGMFEKSKKVPVNSGADLLCVAASILQASGCLFLLSKLSNKQG